MTQPNSTREIDTHLVEPRTPLAQRVRHICMLVLTPARSTVHVRREANALAAAGYAVTLIDVEHDPDPPGDETVDGLRLHHVYVAQRNASHYDPVAFVPWLLFKVLRVIRTASAVVATRADAYHAHDITALPACYIAAVLRRKPLVFDAHELPLTQQHLVRHRLMNALSRAMLRLMMRRCTATITVSPPLVHEMRRLYGGPDATVLRNIPDYQRPVDQDRLRRHFGLAQGARIALYQGTFQANRSLDILVRAAPFLAPSNFIVFMGAGESRGELEQLIAALDVGDRVLIKSAVPYAELLSWTTSADLGLCVLSPDESMSIRYCLPNKLFEYLMAGLPVLTTPLDAVVELLHQHNAGGVIASLAPEAIAMAINRLLDDPQALAQMRMNALNACRTELRWDLEQQRLTDLYARL
jgi:glycosyltransferase involved in cell wall biosynthesis